MATANLNLEQPGYLSDGETGIGNYSSNFAKIDALINIILIYDGDIVTYNNVLVIAVL